MDFENYRFFYLNIILCLLLLFNQFYLFCLFFSFKIPYLLNLETEIEYEFDYDYINYEDNDTRYLETDIDDEHLYTLIYQEFYVLANCKFQFEIYGGHSTLDYIDFLDFIIYNINDERNYKYIYNDVILYNKYKNEEGNYNSKLSIVKNMYINNNYNEKYIKKDEDRLNEEINELPSSWGPQKKVIDDIELNNFKTKFFNFMSNHELYQKNLDKIKKKNWRDKNGKDI